MVWSKWNNPDGTRMSCLEEGCDRPIRSTGLCERHYQKRRASGTLPEDLKFSGWDLEDGSRARCKVADCSKPVKVVGLCSTHYHRNYKTGSFELSGYDYLPICPVDHCDKRMRETSKVCKRCYQKSWRFGLTPEAFIELARPENYHCHNDGCPGTGVLHLDHDHSCCAEASSLRGGKRACGNCVRGWLCSNCNTALGLLREDTGRILGLIGYLERVKRRAATPTATPHAGRK